jgi:hypothetical protein
MGTKIHQIRKTSFFPKESWLSQAKFVWKTLVVLLLSVLLFAPTPVLADYNDPGLAAKFDRIATSITDLPRLSYNEGQETLAKIDNQLRVIQDDVENLAKIRKDISAQVQASIEKSLDRINEPDIDKQELAMLQEELTRLKNLDSVAYQIGLGDPNLMRLILHIQILEERIRSKMLLIDDNDKRKRDIEEENKLWSYFLVENSRQSLFYNNIEKRINLARKKANNVRQYASELKSFSQPDVLNEISELHKLVRSITGV